MSLQLDLSYKFKTPHKPKKKKYSHFSIMSSGAAHSDIQHTLILSLTHAPHFLLHSCSYLLPYERNALVPYQYTYTCKHNSDATHTYSRTHTM